MHDHDAAAALALALALILSGPRAPATAPPPPRPAPGWASPVPMPEGSRPYAPARVTQSVYVTTHLGLSGETLFHGDVIERVPVSDPKWRGAGGLLGVAGWTSRKYRLVPGDVKQWVGPIEVENSFKEKQTNRAMLREYPSGAVFDELLLNADGKLFEHRRAEKKAGRWRFFVAHKDEAARPEGYAGLKVSCASCHSEVGQGKYAEGLVQGGDRIFSDPLPWEAMKAKYAPTIWFREGK